MAIRVHVDVVSAEELIFSGETDFAVFPGEAGELGIYPRHTPLLTRIRPGTVRLKVPDRDEYEMVYVSGGMLEVQPALITVLADTAIRAHDLDEAKAMEAKRRAEEALRIAVQTSVWRRRRQNLRRPSHSCRPSRGYAIGTRSFSPAGECQPCDKGSSQAAFFCNQESA
jgi:F-type H+-transporting ATPase subunit epsilon